MKIHHFILDTNLQKGELNITNTEVVHQIKDVLKLEIGEKIILCDGKGVEAEANILDIDKKKILLDIAQPRCRNNEPIRKVILYLSILKRENFELAVQKAVEVGVAEIVPVISERTIKTKLNEDRLKKIIKEATEQAERTVLPILRPAVDLKMALADSKNNNINLFFDPSGDKVPVHAGMAPKIGVFIGPEGGWTENELISARMSGCELVCLGKTILRGETAAIVGTYLAIFIF